MAARTVCMAAVFMIASVVAQANQCPSGGECSSDDMPKHVVSMVQANLQVLARKDGSQENAAGQRWHSPQVQKYIQYLESLEGSPPSLLAEKVEVHRAQPDGAWPSGSETLFIVTSDSNHYAHNLRWISDTWAKDLSSSQILAIGDEANEGNHSTTMRVETTRCPAHVLEGACCKGGEAIITAHRELEKQPHLKWAYIVEDDSYVRAEAMDKQLKLQDPVGEGSRGTLIALGGCGAEARCPYGVCGAGGIALSRQALMTMVGNSPSKYLSAHMASCEICTNARGDEAIGTQAEAHGVNVIPYGPIQTGMHWLVPGVQIAFARTLTAHFEPLIYHPMKYGGKYAFLDQLFAKQQKGVEDLHSVTSNGSGGCCATYKGNTVCTSNIVDAPWGLPGSYC